ncbi:hypothetical protein [Polaribacter sp.]|uniref:mechanosensitive ion channel family protein n=1 Tax=Polaribacter sp. TaxID=1920175 RepID=UPI0025D5CBEF|nr:hypothetical protein [Polaribacter sp.]
MNIIIDKLKSWKVLFLENIPNIAIAIVVLFLSYFASRAISTFVNKAIGRRISQQSVRNLVSRVVSAFIFLLGLYFAMTILKFDETLKAIISAAGISGIVIGLAL